MAVASKSKKFSNDMNVAAHDMSQHIPEITEDEKMHARLVVAAHVTPKQGLGTVLDMLGIGRETLA